MANRKFKSDATINWDVFRANLQKLLNSRGLTATDFARDVNLSPGTVLRWMYERTPDILAAVITADYFGVSLDWLIGRTERQYAELPQNLQDIVNRYSAASEQDKLIVDTLLSRYA
jgi:transcriptional regulator with XRE-family HTH domain